MSSVRRSGPASIGTPRISKKPLAVLAAAASLLSCATPTQVYITITTDLPCSRIKTVEVSVGTKDTIEEADPASTNDPLKCHTPEGENTEIGTIVITPKAAKNDRFTVMVVAAIDTPIDECGKKGNYKGCIVARRSLNFIPKSDLKMPIFLSSSCEGVGCTAGQDQTCVLGACVSALIEDSSVCDTEDNIGCGDDVLTGQDQPPTAQDLVECGRPSAIVDDFSTDMAMSHWNVEGFTGGAKQIEGELVLSPPKGVSTPTEVQYRSDHAVNIDGDAITVKVPSMLNTASGARAYLAAELDAKNQLRIEQKQGKIWFLSPDPVTGALGGSSQDYDPKKHIYWEIRPTATNVVMRTSPDGYDWSLGASVPRESVAHFIDHVNIVLGAGVDGMEADPKSVTFDDLNLGRMAPEPAWCVPDPMSDTFDGTEPASKWRVEEPEGGACSLTQKEGALFLETTPTLQPTRCSYQSRTAFDFTGKAIVLNLETISMTEPGVDFLLGLEDDSGHRADLGVHVSQQSDVMVQNKLVLYYVRPPTGESEEKLFDAAAHKFLRIYERGGELHWETSATGVDPWEGFKTGSPGFNTKAAHVIIRLDSYYELKTQVAVKVADISVTKSPPPPPAPP
ncbi:MAG TPA: hypothetical protein VE093_48885 [Polyangiaceae bacterium]|nr:hypothetical protein [Polyangiaceae bacterium]